MIGIAHIIALGVAGLSSLLLLPILVALGDGMGDYALLMLIFAILGIFVSLTVLAAIANTNYVLGRSQTFLALILLWLVMTFVSTLSLIVFANLAPSAALFEAMSALTTSGASVITKDTASNALLMWRSMLEWYGGFLTLLSVLHILAPGEFGGLTTSDRKLKSRHGQRYWFPDSSGYQRLITEYAFLTLLIIAALIATGQGGLNATMLGMVSIATGGFLPFSGALDEQVSKAGQIVISLGLLIGTINIFWRRSIIRSPRLIFQVNKELYYILSVIGVLSLIYAARFTSLAGGQADISRLWSSLTEGFFNATSLVATSGFETRPGAIAVLPDIIVLIVVAIGASIYSTTGGIKIYRIVMMTRHGMRELNRLIYPNMAKNLRFGGTIIDDDKMSSIWSHFVLSLIVMGGCAFLLSLFQFSFEAAITFSIALFSNAAPVYSALIPPFLDISDTAQNWPVFSDLTDFSYILSALIMLVGRLEVIIIFAVLNLKYWSSR